MTTLENVFTQPTADGKESVKTSSTQTASAVRTQEQVIYVKVVRAFAMLVIVTFHVTFPLIYLYNSISYSDWWIANNFYIWGKIGSPLFTMVSGMLLLNPSKDQPITVFFKKRFVKVLLPFVFWSLIYLLWRIFIRGDAFTPKQALVLFIEGPVYYHLWFIQMILGLYLATPILRIYIRHAKRENLTYFLIVWFVTDSLLPLTSRFLGFKIGIDVVVTTGYVGFFVLGYYLRDVTLTRRQVIPVLLTIVTLLLFTQYATHALTVRNQGAFDNFFVLNDSFNLVIVALGLFLIFKSIDYELLFHKFFFLEKIVLWISSCSLGVYFVHVVIIEELAGGRLGFILNANSFNPLISIPAISLLVMVLSVGATMLLKQVPLVRNIVP
ncbi:acyltransferase family protein [soil metagenome]